MNIYSLFIQKSMQKYNFIMYQYNYIMYIIKLEF